MQPEDAQQNQVPEAAQDIQSVGLKKALAQDKEVAWQKIDAVYNAAKKAYIDGASLPDVLNSFATTLLQIKDAETQGLGGMGQGPEMDLPQNPAPEEMPA